MVAPNSKQSAFPFRASHRAPNGSKRERAQRKADFGKEELSGDPGEGPALAAPCPGRHFPAIAGRQPQHGQQQNTGVFTAHLAKEVNLYKSF